MEDISEVTPFKILSIDGGGIKGLYSAKILEHLEEKYGVISDYFDMICGTSTGGLIAIALALKIPTSEISSLYENRGQVIFPKRNKWKGIIRQILWKGKYSDIPLREVLKELFGDKKIGDVNNLLCIPSYSVTDDRPWVFKYDHTEGELERDNKTYCVDVALATSAAPTYFPICEIDYYDSKQFIDGGVWANNPAMVGVIEAIKRFVGFGKKFTSIEILSISSLNYSGGKPVGLKRERSFFDWRNDLFDVSLVGQSHFTDYIMKTLCEMNEIDIYYQRIPSEDVSAEQRHLVQLDCADSNAIRFIMGKGNDRGLVAKKDPLIGRFFNELKRYKI